MLRSPAPALVVATPAAVGDEVAAGAPVLVLESMKMETVLHAPFAGRVRELLVTTGSQVETGAPLVRLEPVAGRRRAQDDAAGRGGPDLDLPQRDGEALRRASAPPAALADLSAIAARLRRRRRTTEAAALTGYLAAREELARPGVDVADRRDRAARRCSPTSPS